MTEEGREAVISSPLTMLPKIKGIISQNTKHTFYRVRDVAQWIIMSGSLVITSFNGFKLKLTGRSKKENNNLQTKLQRTRSDKVIRTWRFLVPIAASFKVLVQEF